MLFTPKHSPTWGQRLRVAVWPRRSWQRSSRYIGWRVMRLGGSPHGLALGVAIGVFVATLPIPGAQFLAAAVAAWVLRGNVPAALLGTFWANPVTVPVLWLSAHWLGCLMLGTPVVFQATDFFARMAQVKSALLAPGAETLSAAYAVLWPVFKPLVIGALPLAAVSAAVFYGLTLYLLQGYRERRLTERSAVGSVRDPMDALELGDFSGRMT
jgi:uncharacterized protein